jgi:cytoskeletal protein RodZ
MNTRNKKNTLKTKKTLLILLITASISVIMGALYFFVFKDKTKQSGNQSQESSTINYNPPTQQEKEETDAFKKESTQEQTNTNTPSKEENTTNVPSGSVKPVITDAGVYGTNAEVASFIPGVYESGGSCKTTLIKGSRTIERSSGAIQDATTTRCPTTIISTSELGKGTWTATVTYTSSNYQGTSNAQEVTTN